MLKCRRLKSPTVLFLFAVAAFGCGSGDATGTPPSPVPDASTQEAGDAAPQDAHADALPDVDAAVDAPAPDSGDGAATDVEGDVAQDAPGPDAQDDSAVVDAQEEDAAFDAADDAVDDAPVDAGEDAAEADTDGQVPLVCTTCHGNAAAHEAAPPVDTHSNSATTSRGVGAHAAHRKVEATAQGVPHGPFPCQSCHIVPGDVDELGHLDSTTGAEVNFSGLATADGAVPAAWESNVSSSCTGVYCHGATLSGGSLTTPTWTQVDGSQAVCGSCHGTPPSAQHPASAQCNMCHSAVIASCPGPTPADCVFQDDVAPDKSYKLHINGKVEVAGQGCTGCHGAPPANGAHVVHAAGADAPTVYGSLEPRANATGYAFNCGYCHPLDASRHMDGTLQVELYNPQAPLPPADPSSPADRRSMKGSSPGAAWVAGPTSFPGDIHTYTDGTCSQVYCHSEQVEASPSVPAPTNVVGAPRFVWKTTNGFMDAPANTCCVDTTDDYGDFAITVSRVYASPKWAGETHTGAERCGHCHGYPPRNSAPENNGAGDSHAWFVPASEGGYENGHFYNMGAGEPNQCRRCHADTVANDLPSTQWHYESGNGAISFDEAMQIGGFAAHVNGKKDVVFNVSPASCGSATPDLPYAATPCLVAPQYDPSSRTCSNVDCHLAQTQVVWGAPYRESVMSECNACHQY